MTFSALLDDPQYVKALQRRAASNETIGSWSSLTAAQEGVFSLCTFIEILTISQRLSHFDQAPSTIFLPTARRTKVTGVAEASIRVGSETRDSRDAGQT